MLRSLFIFLSKIIWLRRLMSNWGIARRTASRFVAGETLQDALEVVRVLNDRGMNATLDHLGENTSSLEEAQATTTVILKMLGELERSGLRSNISIKLTQIGLLLDEQICGQNLKDILEQARNLNTFVRVDMEDSPTVDATLRLYRQMRNKHGFDNVGLVIQSYLYRSEEDTRQLLNEGTRIRLVKGAYMEPPEIAFPKKIDVEKCFDRLTEMLLKAGLAEDRVITRTDGKWPPIAAIASHDEKRIEYAKDYAQQIELPKDKIEFQMLYGIRRDLQKQLVAEGYPVRIYIPFGSHWYPYLMRRLAERPANFIFFLTSFFKK